MLRVRTAALGLVGAVCLLSPTLIGGVLPLWTPAFAAAGALSCGLCLWADHRRQHLGDPPRLWLLFLLPAIVAALQLVPLPMALLGLLSPRAAELRGGAGPLSLDVPGTAYELARALGLLCLSMVAERLCVDRRRSRVLLYVLFAAGMVQVLVTAIHLLQRNTTSVLGLYPLPPGWESGLGTFVNRNHAACLLLLSSGASAGLLLEGSRGWRRPLLLAGLLLQLLALFLSLSRGGLAAAAVASALLLGARLRRQIGLGVALLLGLGMSALVALLSVVLLPGFAQRLQPLYDGSLWHYQKVQVWRDVLPLLVDFWLTGTGRGAFQSVFASYRTGDEYVSVPYAASLPLQQAAELGLPVTLSLWGLGVLFALRLWQRRGRLGWAELGTAAGLFAVLLHNFVDFGLELPGVAIPAVLALSLITARAYRRDAVVSSRRVRWPGLLCLGTAAAALFAIPVSGQLLSTDKARIRAALRGNDVAAAERLFLAATRRHPADHHVALLGAQAALRGEKIQLEVLRRTNRALVLHPADAQAHRLAARVLAQRGHRSQAALEMRLAFGRGFVADQAGLAEAAALVAPAELPDTLPQHPDVQRRLATYLDGKGHRAEAHRARRRALLLDPAWPAGPAALGWTADESSQLE